MVVAKTEAAMRSLSIAFAKGHVRKTYNAVVRGSMQGKGTVDGALNGRRAVTEWRCVRRARSGEGTGMREWNWEGGSLRQARSGEGRRG